MEGPSHRNANLIFVLTIVATAIDIAHLYQNAVMMIHFSFEPANELYLKSLLVEYCNASLDHLQNRSKPSHVEWTGSRVRGSRRPTSSSVLPLRP